MRSYDADRNLRRLLVWFHRFTFGTGKMGDLAGFTSAIIFAKSALLIGYESRMLSPSATHSREAIPIAR